MNDSIFDDLPVYDGSKQAEMRAIAREAVSEFISKQATDDWMESSAAVVDKLFKLSLAIGIILGVGATTLFGAELWDHFAGPKLDQFGRAITSWRWSLAGFTSSATALAVAAHMMASSD